jgi:hypothetical protein
MAMNRFLQGILAISAPAYVSLAVGCGAGSETTTTTTPPTDDAGVPIVKCTPDDVNAPCKCGETESTGICGADGRLLQCECGTGTASDPVDISSSGQAALEVEDHMAVTKNGTVAVAWITQSQTGGGIGYAVSSDRGATWAKPQAALIDKKREASDPVLTSDGTNLYLSWISFTRAGQSQASNMSFVVSTLAAGESAFGAPVTVETSPDGGDKPWLGVTKSGTVVLSYMTGNGANTSLKMARSSDQGATWSKTTVQKVQGNFIVPCVSYASDRVWVAYLDFAAGALLKTRWSDDDGVTWPAANTKSMTNLPVVQPPSCMARGSNVYVAFPYVRSLQSQDQPGEEYHVVKFDGKSPVTEVRADDNATKASHLGLLVPEDLPNALSIVYYGGQRNPDPKGMVRINRSVDDGMTWGTSVAISPALKFTTDRTNFDWLGDYLGASQIGNEVLVAYGDNSKLTQGQNVTHISFVKVSRQ